MATLSFGNVHAFVGTLEFELELLRRLAARERLLRLRDAAAIPARRHRRTPVRGRRPGTPHLTGAH